MLHFKITKCVGRTWSFFFGSLTIVTLKSKDQSFKLSLLIDQEDVARHKHDPQGERANKEYYLNVLKRLRYSETETEKKLLAKTKLFNFVQNYNELVFNIPKTQYKVCFPK